IVEFADIQRGEKITPVDWQHALFSRNFYANRNSATGQAVHGSLNDYFHEQSYGKFRVEGRVFEPVRLSKKRADYWKGAGAGIKSAVFSEALAKVEAREAKGVWNGFDGLCFIYAGARVQTNAGSPYYPHRGSLMFQGKRWAYIACPEGGSQMESICTFAPEF